MGGLLAGRLPAARRRCEFVRLSAGGKQIRTLGPKCHDNASLCGERPHQSQRADLAGASPFRCHQPLASIARCSHRARFAVIQAGQMNDPRPETAGIWRMSVHSDLGLLAQCRRGLLRQADQATVETRRVPIPGRSPGRHQSLHGRDQSQSQTLRLDRRSRQNHRCRQTRV